jgi:hypothetical protein
LSRFAVGSQGFVGLADRQLRNEGVGAVKFLKFDCFAS